MVCNNRGRRATNALWAWSANVDWLERVGAAVIVAGLVFVIYRLHATRLARPAANPDAPVREFCRAELARVEEQIYLLSTVLVWYVGPIIVGVALIVVGRVGFSPMGLFCLAVVGGIGWAIHALNQHAVRSQLRPIREELAGLIEQLDSDSEPDGG